MEVVNVSFKRLLLEITQKLSMPTPKYDLAVDSSGQFSACVDVEVQRAENVTELVRSWGASAPVAGTSEEDAARNCISTLRDDLGFDVRDTNFDDLKFYKSLYTQLVEQYNALMAKYNTLKWDYKFLKDCYGKAMDEKERAFTKRCEIQQHLENIFNIMNHPGMVVDAPEEGAAQEPSAGSG